MTPQSLSPKPLATVNDLCMAMERIAPVALAQSWDNVGLIAGDHAAAVGRVLLCIDLTSPVVEEALAEKVEAIVAYHPPIFKPISSLHADSAGTDAAVFRCIRNGIALYSTHTALDAADGGTNDVLAALCDVPKTEPLEYVDKPGIEECKLVVTVPPESVDVVSEAVFAAGAGHIGDYSHCSYRGAVEGTFLGSETTNPALGQRGRPETVSELRLETIVKSSDLPAVVAALIDAHPYEEPAFDIYPLKARPVRGIGRCGSFRKETTLGALAEKLKGATGAASVQMVGQADRTVTRAVIVAGAAGSLPFGSRLSQSDVVITGEMRHHDALTIARLGATAIVLGHWASERPVLSALGKQLQEAMPGVTAVLSKSDRDPFSAA